MSIIFVYQDDVQRNFWRNQSVEESEWNNFNSAGDLQNVTEAYRQTISCNVKSVGNQRTAILERVVPKIKRKV